MLVRLRRPVFRLLWNAIFYVPEPAILHIKQFQLLEIAVVHLKSIYEQKLIHTEPFQMEARHDGTSMCVA